MKEDNGRWHTVLGVSEIENRHVLEDLVAEPEIAEANYQIVHYDGPDQRGVDVALLYKPEQMTVVESESIPFTFDSQSIKFSMTPEERANPKLLSPQRKYRIAKGSGNDIADVNRFIKQFRQMQEMVKKMPGLAGRKHHGNPFGGFGMGRRGSGNPFAGGGRFPF